MSGRWAYRRSGVSMIGRSLTIAAASSLAAATMLVHTGGASAQTMSDLAAQRVGQGAGKDKLAVEAKELTYDKDRDTVSAVGDVHLYYQGRALEADKVTYNRATKRVFATGNVRLTETDGQVVTGERFELTDDFKSGFIDSLRIETKDKTRFSAARAERIEGETTVFERGTYTACDVCKDDPSRPPLWQVRAKKIIHKESEHTVYYEDATLELYGLPIAYLPFFSAPDATVRRKTGVLAPHYIVSTALGSGVLVPYFINLAPNYDVTLTPGVFSRQGFLGQAEFRHRLVSGSYVIRAAGIFQLDKDAFLPEPLGARNKEFRGDIETAGKFYINEKWKYGWDISLLSDKWFLANYKVRSDSLSAVGSGTFKESTSTVYLTGQGDRSFFDARGYYFRVLSSYDWQKLQPVVHPVIDYDRRFTGPQPLGGEIGLTANLTSISREQTDFRSLFDAAGNPGRFLFPIIDGKGATQYLYDTCAFYEKGKCLVRGVAGNYTRLSAELSWRRQFVDQFGQVFTPFASARVDGAFTQLHEAGRFNQFLPNFVETDGTFTGRVMPTVGATYRYPFVATTDYGTHIIEPIAQIIARPNESAIGRLPNEDAQSLVFDDSNLFTVNKFSGYDRLEGGVRANIGAQYTLTLPGGGYANALFGQSYQLAGINSFAAGDLLNTGIRSGLDTSPSDYVARVRFSPDNNLTFVGRGRFDQETFAPRRLEFQSTATLFDRLTASVLYARYAPQPELGQVTRREGLSTSAQLKITPEWYVSASTAFDLTRYMKDDLRYKTDVATLVARGDKLLAASVPPPHNNPFAVASFSLGAGYRDECTTFGVTYSSSPADNTVGTKQNIQTILVKLELRSLGSANFTQHINSSATQDGLASTTTTE